MNDIAPTALFRHSPLSEALDIRPAKPQDNEQLLALTHRAPIHTAFGVMNIERAPDYFALNRARGDVDVLVAELRGEIVGAVSMTPRDVSVGGSTKRAYYLGDFKVRPDVRRSKVGATLAVAGFRWMRERDADYAIGVATRSNKASMTFLAERYDWEPFRFPGRLLCYTIRLAREARLTGRYETGPAKADEIPDLTTLHNRHYGHFNFYTPYTPESFHAMLVRTPGYTLDDLLVARVDRRPVAMVGVWNPRPVKQVVFVAYRPIISKGLNVLTRLLSRLGRRFWYPEEGKPWSLGYLRHYAAHADHLPALAQLVRECCERSRKEGRFQSLIASFDRRDPTRKVLKGLPRHRGAMIFGYTPLRDPQGLDGLVASRGPFYEDITLA